MNSCGALLNAVLPYNSPLNLFALQIFIQFIPHMQIMFDQKQKSLGLPTSDDILKSDIIEKTKGLPGSPFA